MVAGILAAFAIAGCESARPLMPRTHALYLSAMDAQNIANGRFGALPVAFLDAHELSRMPICRPRDARDVARVQLDAGAFAWIPASDLPAKVSDCPH